MTFLQQHRSDGVEWKNNFTLALEGLLLEVATCYFKLRSEHLPEYTEEYHE